MSKFTPGPWTYYRHDESYGTSFNVAQADGATYTPNYSDVAFWSCSTCPGELMSVQEANARLISAAPDLLEALKAFDQAAKDAGSIIGFAGKALPLLQQARAAIAKATGEQS